MSLLMSEAIVEQPQCYRKNKGVLPNPVQPAAHSEHNAFQLEDHTNSGIMQEATGAAVEHRTHSRRSTTARTRRWDALHIPVEGTATAHELMPRSVAQRTRSRVSQPPRGQVLEDLAEQSIGIPREVRIVQRPRVEQPNSRSDQDTVTPQPPVRGRSESSFQQGEMRARVSQSPRGRMFGGLAEQSIGIPREVRIVQRPRVEQPNSLQRSDRDTVTAEQSIGVPREVRIVQRPRVEQPNSLQRSDRDTVTAEQSIGIPREVRIVHRPRVEQPNSLQRSDTVIPPVRGRSESSFQQGEMRATRSQFTDGNGSNIRRTLASGRQGRSAVRDVPYTRVRVASAPAARGREANGIARNGREASATREHRDMAGDRQPFQRLRHRSRARETNVPHSHSGEGSVPIAHGREADGPAANGRGTSVTDEHNEMTATSQPCPRLRPQTDQHRRRGTRRNNSNEEREPYSLRPRVERPTYIANTLSRRRNRPNWRTQLRTQMRQYMDEIFAAYVNAMLFGNQKREVKDLPEVAVNEEQVLSGLKCSVCLLDFVLDEVVYKLPCDHIYHKNCIIPWLEQNDNCPMCRRPVEDDDDDDESGDDDILPEDDDDGDGDSSNQRARFRIVVGDADVTVIAHDSANESSSTSDSDFELFMNSDDF